MSSLFEPYRIVNKRNSDGSITVDVNADIADWIWSQPTREWATAEFEQWPYHRYYVSEEILTMIALKWTS